MRRAEVEAAMDETARLSAAVLDACPTQTEEHDGRIISWHLDLSPGVPHRAKTLMSARHLWRDNVPTSYIARVMEVRAALEKWERGEGEWPLARTAETKPTVVAGCTHPRAQSTLEGNRCYDCGAKLT